MRAVQSVLLLFVFWCFLSTQVEGQISARNVLIRAPPPPPDRGAPNPGPGKGPRSPPPGKGPGKKAAPAPPPISTTETTTTTTTTTQSTTEAPPPPSTSTTTTSTSTSVEPPSTTSSTVAPPPSTSPIASETFIVSRPILTILPTRISAVLPTPTPTTSVLPTVPLVSGTISETAVESTPAGTTRATLIPIPAPLPSLPVPPPPGIVFKEPNPASKASSPQRTLVIVLSVVLGSVGLLLASLAFFLVCRYRKRKKASLRQVSPVEDEEIQGWRRPDFKAPIVASPTYPQRVSLNRAIDAPLASPGWEWFSLDGSRMNTPAHSRGPSLIAKAPNARLGLTTDSLPGEDPYLPPIRRQSSRLSKTHQRTKSTKSSLSVKTTPSVERLNDGTINYLGTEYGSSNWFNMDRRSNIISNAETNSVRTSVYDNFNDIGGLAPMPRNPLVPVFPKFGQPTALSPPPRRINNITPKSP